MSPRSARRCTASLLAVCVVLAAAHGLKAADDDFTDIPDFPETPAPTVSAKPPTVIKPSPTPATRPAIAPVGPKALIEKIEDSRLRAITARVLSITVCGRSLPAIHVRQSHAFIARGDEWLERADRLWLAAVRTGERGPAEIALRYMTVALGDYKSARDPSTLKYTADDSPPPRPFPSASPQEEHPGTPGMGRRRDPVKEPVIWGKWNEIPLE